MFIISCPYCKIEMCPSGHSSGVCNGWSCSKCEHEEPEMGSWALGGRQSIGECFCKNCLIKKEKNK